MLLKNYKLDVFRSKCQSDSKGVHCFAHLEQDVSEALPYLNTVLGGFEYLQDPPAVVFKPYGKLITVHARKIAVNALKSREEAVKIVEWLKNEINCAWARRDEIEPSYSGQPRPTILEIFKLLPKNNCKECKEPTCLVFATKVAEGSKSAEDCPPIDPEKKKLLERYMAQFDQQTW